MKVEIIASSYDDAVAAQRGGAHRVEVCIGIEVGGLTPPLSVVRQISKIEGLEVAAMVRPRSGGFCYSEDEKRLIEQQVSEFAEIQGVAIVFGALQSNGTLDTEYLSSLVQTFPDTEWVCHRCFDLIPNPDFALEQLISLGFSRVLTSGHQRTAIEGYELIRHLLEIANGRIEIMAGSGIRSHNVRAFLGSFHASALDSVHASCWKEHRGLVNCKGEVDFGPDLSVDQMKVESLVREVFG